ncbi:MAG: ribonuclease P protein component [Phycisphaerales bacterium]|nr:ribonuclease P protein component [Phycisphaerales bacterium]
MTPAPRKFAFPRALRLTLDRQYQAVRAGGTRRSAGPLTLTALPNSLDHHRLGLSISRRVGPAVRRNALKRMLRESFRLLRVELAPAPGGGLDLVIAARAHDPAPLSRYQDWLRELVTKAARGTPRPNNPPGE